MTDRRIHPQTDPGNLRKNSDDRARGDEPMTGAQRSYLQALCEEAGQPFDDTLTKAQASRRIDELHRLTRRDAAADGTSRA